MSQLFEFKISDTHIVPIEIEKKLNTRSISLRQNPKINGFKLSIPWLMSHKEAVNFINKNHTWIIKHSLYITPIQQYEIGSEILFLGDQYEIQHSNKLRGVTVIDNKTIILSGSTTNIRTKLHNFLKKELIKQTSELIKHHTQTMKVSFKKLDVRNTNSRWGSCSSSGRIMLSLKLALCPFDIIEYVIVHELCHLFEMNHSKKFWKLVSEHYPNYREAEKWLKTQGRKIPIL